MGKFRILYLPVAEKDLLEIIDYIRKDNSRAAMALLDEIDHTMARLEEFPESGAKPSDLRLARMGYRIMAIGNYIVFYVIKGSIVEIRRIIHGRRRYEFLL